MMHIQCLVVLEVMWGVKQPIAPSLFQINRNNFSGRRLYYLIGHSNFLVTNACVEQVANAQQKGTPDPQRLARTLQRISYHLLLVCGNVAWDTYKNCGYKPDCAVLRMKHPAARTWTKQELAHWKDRIEKHRLPF